MERNNKRVLVIEDHRGSAVHAFYPAFSAGYTVYGAANGLEGLGQMEKHSIDVVLTDYSHAGHGRIRILIRLSYEVAWNSLS